jgi:hypothetical protein
LAAKGEWGKSDAEIISLAGISRDSFYRLKKRDDTVKAKLEDYKHQTLGRRPARPQDF